MNARRPGTHVEYSRGGEASSALSARRFAPRPGLNGVRAAVLLGGLIGASLLVVAELTTLFTVRVATSSRPLSSVATGPHHSYALIPLALLAAGLAITVFRQGAMPALLAISALGLSALLIALIGDLHDAQASGVVLIGGHYVNASSSPSAGLYLETLGAVVLIVASGSGLLLAGSSVTGGGVTAPPAPEPRSAS